MPRTRRLVFNRKRAANRQGLHGSARRNYMKGGFGKK